MKKLGSSFLVASLAFSIGFAAFSAHAAQPVTDPSAPGSVTNVQYYGGGNREWQQYPERNWRNEMEPRRYYRENRPRWRSVPERQRPAYRGSSQHVRWCYNRYRSYRAYDNTFQPNHGPRRQCYSPFI